MRSGSLSGHNKLLRRRYVAAAPPSSFRFTVAATQVLVAYPCDITSRR